MPEHVFVYGTLQSCVRGPMGAPQRRALRWHARLEGRASMSGRLFDLGAYPGCVPDSRRSRRVHGEVWRVVDGRRLWPVLDAYEGVEERPAHSLERSFQGLWSMSGEVRAGNGARPGLAGAGRRAQDDAASPAHGRPLLPARDGLEDAAAVASQYERVWHTVQAYGGGVMIAWVYLCIADLGGCPVIAGGRWPPVVQERGRRSRAHAPA